MGDVIGRMFQEEKIVEPARVEQGELLNTPMGSDNLNLMGGNFQQADRENRSPMNPIVPMDKRNPNLMNTSGDIANELMANNQGFKFPVDVPGGRDMTSGPPYFGANETFLITPLRS